MIYVGKGIKCHLKDIMVMSDRELESIYRCSKLLTILKENPLTSVDKSSLKEAID